MPFVHSKTCHKGLLCSRTIRWAYHFVPILSVQVSWTAKKTNEWVINKAGVKRELLDTNKARKLAYYGHIMRKQRSCLEKEIGQGTMPGTRRRGRPRTAWIDNIKTWTRLPVEEINGESTSMVWLTLRSRMAKEQNRTKKVHS